MDAGKGKPRTNHSTGHLRSWKSYRKMLDAQENNSRMPLHISPDHMAQLVRLMTATGRTAADVVDSVLDAGLKAHQHHDKHTPLRVFCRKLKAVYEWAIWNLESIRAKAVTELHRRGEA